MLKSKLPNLLQIIACIRLVLVTDSFLAILELMALLDQHSKGIPTMSGLSTMFSFTLPNLIPLMIISSTKEQHYKKVHHFKRA